jgi:hypothetical protein
VFTIFGLGSGFFQLGEDHQIWIGSSEGEEILAVVKGKLS